MLGILSQIDTGLAAQVAYNIGVHVPQKPEQPMNHSIPADGNPADFQPVIKEGPLDRSPALSMAFTVKDSIRTRKIAILVAEGVNAGSLQNTGDALKAEGAAVEIIAPRLGTIMAEDDTAITVDKSFLTAASVFYDAVYVPGGTASVATLAADPDAIHFLNEAFRHCKAIAADTDAMQVLQETYFYKKLPPDNAPDTVMMEGIIIGDGAGDLPGAFIAAIGQHRFWDREKPRKVPA
jgi:catalase